MNYNITMIDFVTIRVLVTLMDGKTHSAKALAEANEVSQKTIQRAISRLESAGVFVASTRGKFGGYKLEKNSIPQLLSIPAEELGELMSICKFKQSLLPSSCSFDSIQDAIINSMPEKHLGRALSASSKIVFDSLPWKNQRIESQKLELVYTACMQSHTLELVYMTYSGSETRRHINPYCLTLKDGAWYTYAEDTDTKTMKLFRLSRMKNIQELKQTFCPNPNIIVHDRPWNNSSQFETKLIKVRIKKNRLQETRDWLNYTVLETHENYVVAEAIVQDNLGFYYKLIEESKNTQLLSPYEMIQNLVVLCKDVEQIFQKSV